MKYLLFFFLFINISFANSENVSRMNALKKVIQKEEYIALAINKYILQTGTIPKTSENILAWGKLEVDDYLGSSFNRTNPITSEDMSVYYDTGSHNFFIRGVVDYIGNTRKTNYDDTLLYIYNFYTSRIFRVNTLAPEDKKEENLLIGSQVIYSNIQKEIVDTLNLISPEVNTIKLDSQACTPGNYYYELKGEKLTLKYCKNDDSITVYQESPIYVEDIDDLQYIKATIGDVAYVSKNGIWYEYYYQGETSPPWIPEYLGSTLSQTEDIENINDLINNYVSDSNDLLFRQDGGCMLVKGDISCWGNNDYKKVGIESYGQVDKTLSPDYVNTPVMLKVQIDDTTKINNVSRNDKNWYNNPYRVKFDKMAMNSTNVCGITAIIEIENSAYKTGGDLYCNGILSSTHFEDVDDEKDITKNSSILKKSIFFAEGKDDLIDDDNDDEIYLQDIVMIEDTAIVLSDEGKIYSFGRNYKGALGIGSDDKFLINNKPVYIDENDENSYPKFEKIFALRDIKGLGAIDEDGVFWIWGERPNGTIYYRPTKLAETITFNKDAIFVSTNEFILKSTGNVFYITTGDDKVEEINSIPNSAISVSAYKDSNDDEFYLYVTDELELLGSDTLLKCMKSNETEACTTNNIKLFNDSITKLNTKSTRDNGEKLANFANVSIFKLDNVITEEFEDFEVISEVERSGWNIYDKTSDGVGLVKSADDNPYDTDTDRVTRTTYPPTAIKTGGGYDDVNRIDPTRILGVIAIGTEYLEKTYDFGNTYANNEIEFEFDFFEIDSWDFEKLNVELNGVNFTDDGFIHDNHQSFEDTNDTGVSIQNLVHIYGTSVTASKYNDEKYHYKLRHKLDEDGKLKVRFSTRLLPSGELGSNQWSRAWQNLNDESWGVDNVHVKVKETNKKFVCAMTGLGSKSQMYCWGNIGRSIPILSTSLYDIGNININKLFITQESEKKNQMSYSPYYSNGKLFLRFPTYIGGFDYGFYFK